MINSKNRVKTLKMICCTSSHKSCVRENNKDFINEIQVSWGHNHQNHSLISEPSHYCSHEWPVDHCFSSLLCDQNNGRGLTTYNHIITSTLYKSLDQCYWSITAASPDRLFVATHMCLAPGSLNTEHAFLSTHISTCSSGGSPGQDKIMVEDTKS